jgi:hypothetical protein
MYESCKIRVVLEQGVLALSQKGPVAGGVRDYGVVQKSTSNQAANCKRWGV